METSADHVEAKKSSPGVNSHLYTLQQLEPKQQYSQRRQQENAQRQSPGEPMLPNKDISKMLKPPLHPPPHCSRSGVRGKNVRKQAGFHVDTEQKYQTGFRAEVLHRV
ncbi:hypothetical protein KOW79_019001 [Hemibagrus wyckioides]|uniref:eIF3h C-terminal domain-containing protein n=1 Tax=Hemibagrus wyckioides TaxID=337641 RepID=A0A9D3N767_9TELE|nr:hypothetical protein KOW79_019001 [Hemibagrus wyckioides]